jgi:hypothetical protein
MEGSHQRGTNWYRCQYVYRRGPAATALADHPKVHGVKEERQRLHLAATVTPELLPDLANASDRPEGRSQINDIAGAGFERVPATAEKSLLLLLAGAYRLRRAHRIEEGWDLVARRPISTSELRANAG